MNRHIFTQFVLFLVILYLVAMLFLFLLITDGWKGWRGWVNGQVLRSDYIAAKNQPVGDQIIIDIARLKKSGFLVILLGDAFDSPGDLVVGTSELLSSGQYKNLVIPLRPEKYLDPERTAPPIIESGVKLYGSIWYSDRADEFTGAETIARDAGGYPILTTFTLL